MSVRMGRMHGKASLTTFIDTLSGPGVLFDGKENMMLRISIVETA